MDLVATWNNSNLNQRQELARTLFPKGLAFSEESLFFEPCNSSLMQLVTEFVEGMSPVGAPDRRILNQLFGLRSILLRFADLELEQRRIT